MNSGKTICFFLFTCFFINAALAGQQDKNETNGQLTPSSYYDRGIAGLAEKNTKDAIADFSQALFLADSLKDFNLILRVMESLSQAYEQSGDDDQALVYTRKYFLLKDSISNIIRIRTLEDLKEKHAETIQLLENNVTGMNERIGKAEAENKNLFNYFILINGLLALVMIVLVLVFVASGRKSRRLVKEYERQLAEEREAAIAAEMKNQEALEKIGKKFNRHAYTQFNLIRLLSEKQGREQSFIDGIRHTNEKILELGSMFNNAGSRGNTFPYNETANTGKKYEGAVSVLVLAEDENNRMVLSGTVQKYFIDAEVQATNSYDTGSGSFDLVILDGWSPDQDIEKVKGTINDLTIKFPDIPVMLVIDDQAIINEFEGKGVTVLSKPLNDDELIRAVFNTSKKQFVAGREKAEPVKEEWKDENFQQLFFKQLPQKLQVIEDAVKRGDWKTIRQRILEVRTMLAFTGMELNDPAFNDFETMDGSTSFMTWHNRTTVFCKRVREKIASLEDAAASGKIS